MGAVLALFRRAEHVRFGERNVRLVREIAKGGYGTVLLASCDGEHYVVKKLICGAEDQLEFAATERDVLSRCSHPSIIPLIGSAQCDTSQGTVVYLLVPYYARGDLGRDVEQNGVYNHKQALEVLLQVAGALQHLVSLDPPLAHHDVKPGNVALDDEGNAILMDFGSCFPARHKFDSHSDAVRLQDTVNQLCSETVRAPELFDLHRDSVVDERTDVWSLGCLLYFMVYGFGPFDAAYAKGDSVKLAAMNGNITYENEDAGSEFFLLMRALLEPDPARRITLGEVLQRTEAILASME